MARERYERQVQLLVRTLPFVARQDVFALKGGTAINLFYRDMPRLSVDIDLVYLPIEDRAASLAGIDTALDDIQADLVRNLRGANVQPDASHGISICSLYVRPSNWRTGVGNVLGRGLAISTCASRLSIWRDGKNPP